MRPRLTGRRDGVTIIEMLIAMVIMGFVVSATMSYFQQQNMVMSAGIERTSMLRNLAFSADLMERELRSVGLNAADDQPFIVYADSMTFAFNADLVGSEMLSIYPDRDVPEGARVTLRASEAITLPNTTQRYPSVDYMKAELRSPAETTIYFFARDTAAGAVPEEFVLFRQVNAQPPEVVARNLKRVPGQPFFEYYHLDGLNRLAAFPRTRVLHHLHPTAHRHGTPEDTGAIADVDRIRAVRIRLAASNGRAGERASTREMTRLVHLTNAGVQKKETCGAPPALGPGFAAVALARDSVRLTWSASPDEMGGEEDVMMYAIWRRASGAATWDDAPIVVVAPSGATQYQYIDASVDLAADSYQYALRAEDCSPRLSEMRTSAIVTHP